MRPGLTAPDTPATGRHRRSAVSTFANVMLITALSLAWYISASTYPNEALGTTGPGTTQAPRTPQPSTPTWTFELAERFEGCRAYQAGDLTDTLVVVDRDGVASRMSTSTAYARDGNVATSDDVWVVGSC